jgi:hypothetical protein
VLQVLHFGLWLSSAFASPQQRVLQPPPGTHTHVGQGGSTAAWHSAKAVCCVSCAAITTNPKRTGASRDEGSREQQAQGAGSRAAQQHGASRRMLDTPHRSPSIPVDLDRAGRRRAYRRRRGSGGGAYRQSAKRLCLCYASSPCYLCVTAVLSASEALTSGRPPRSPAAWAAGAGGRRQRQGSGVARCRASRPRRLPASQGGHSYGCTPFFSALRRASDACARA